MNQISPKKLLHSKWTACEPKNKEKHFLVNEVEFDEDGGVTACSIEAVISGRSMAIEWRQLKDSTQWRQGWQ